MRFDIVTIFPGFFAGFFEHGIVRRAQAEGLVAIAVHDLRVFTHDRHRSVDDRPFGGGEGMVLKPEPLAEALESLGIAAKYIPQGLKPTSSVAGASGTAEAVPLQSPRGQGLDGSARSEAGGRRVILLSAQGRPFTQGVARELAGLERVVLICGRYEGVDERINELYCDLELSIGDYVLSGGELAAAVVLDATMRLIPGVLGNEASGEFESFGAADAAIATDVEGVPRSQHGSGGLLDYPHYTRPAEFGGLKTPEVLLNGDHRQIRKWRREQQLLKTLKNRPDLLEGAELTAAERRLLAEWKSESASRQVG
ncbi:MAG TPA: tRNA (guanosine(37)-N1)-methyltransferase TrmD [Terracidiphilus sp.]|jgi:tRNA (guanine37-N1)-methyltransferase|nr:tRNA (guanosine(37)-N1)-methyltransferase TrmD [Terracidiphilus sp.]